MLKNTAVVGATAWNIGLCPVRPADMFSALRFSGLQTRWAHRLQVCVPNRVLF
jgi:hypothetical protein